MSKYRMIADTLREDILGGVYANGQMLPTEERLCALFEASRQTVRQALSILAREQFIIKQRGSGSRVHLDVKRERSGNVAVITTYISDYIFPGILRDAERVFSAEQYTAILAATHNCISSERKILTDLLSKPIDGILVEGTKTALPNPNLDLYRKFSEKHIPIVFFNGYYTALENTVAVCADNEGGGYRLTTYLLQKGHQRIAGIFKSDDIQGHQRYAGYISALRDAGRIDPASPVFWYETENRDSIVSPALLSALKGCSAVVCYNDEIAFRLISMLQSEKKRVPDDISVVSFDDSSLSELSPVRITSLSYGEQSIGGIAAEKLIKLINGEGVQTQTLCWTLSEKDSSR